MHPERGAVVIGSGQRCASVDAAEARRRNLPVLRRRSGGGAVLVSRADLLWIDVVVARDDPLWDPDVARAFDWLGRAWQRTLATCGIDGELYGGRHDPGRWGSLVCFAGRGPGEVFVEGRKVVGLSQRRTKHCARFQSGLLRRWDPEKLAGLLAVADPERKALVADLGDCAQGIEVPEDRLIGAFVETLGAAGG
jgi:lipoate-protein ligase A